MNFEEKTVSSEEIYDGKIIKVRKEKVELPDGRLATVSYTHLPCIRSTIVVMLIMSLGRILGISFERPYTLDNPLVRDFSDVISTFVYRVGLQSHRYNIATAVGLFQSVVGLIFVFASDKFAKLMGEDGII